MKDNAKNFFAIFLVGIFAYLTLTKSGQEAASKAGEFIVDISDSGITAIKSVEGFSPTPYPDARGYSIGYGHFIQPGENLTFVTEQQAHDLLVQDTATAQAAVRRMVTVPLNQNQFDALVSFVYNVGAANFGNSTLLKKLNASDYAGAAQQFAVWNKSHAPDGSLIVNPTLIARRETEAGLFMA